MTTDQIQELDKFVAEQHSLYMLLFQIIIRQDDRLRLGVAEEIRRILQTPLPTHPISPNVQLQLRTLRDDLLKPARPELVEAFRQPPLRPVE